MPHIKKCRMSHLQLSEEYDQAGDRISEATRPRFEEFIGRAVATGVLLESASERRSAQGLIDYWTSQLQAAGGAESLRSMPLRRYDPGQGLSSRRAPVPTWAWSPTPPPMPTASSVARSFARQVIADLRRFRIVLLQGPAAARPRSCRRACCRCCVKTPSPAAKTGASTLSPGANPVWPKEFLQVEPLPVGNSDRTRRTDGPANHAHRHRSAGGAVPAGLAAEPPGVYGRHHAHLARPDVRILLAMRKEFEGS